ncbi:MAG: 50S ribosomal protein L25 [Planctomycetaceae bacterium]|jgi:large subunit ribosomal protein L25|nr:50S ribosomal protein L25 [Planctomycetaceae bacterium]MBT5123939.1 50S ribosomal protein L25 [Planctomycetaceae bacterium]MBT5597756.1 50S ribosomal protein L25 [Planctomycetaceae bacterium]MBT5882722.1 50S ribosomal protein L25 [Planctomycetaceae bacterium]MBT7255019.1 50S ribosomal protein L25 [Planctomycetaceae bacterium]
MAELFQTELRDLTGSANTRRLRRSGNVPAILYGHGKENVSLSLVSKQVQAAIERREKLVQLEGAVTENALVKAVQWDALGTKVIHLDLTRVDENETVQVTVVIVVKGTAPGLAAGGRVNRTIRRTQITCPVMEIPNKIELNLSTLELNGSLTLADLALPKGVQLVAAPETVVATCTEIIVAEEPTADEATDDAAEPELIGDTGGDDAESSDDADAGGDDGE